MPDWVQPVTEYMLREGLRNTLEIAAVSLVGSLVIGIVLGTLLTIDFLPLRAPIRLYIELWRGLPILVTIFIIFFALPAVNQALEFSPLTAAAIGLILWGSAQVAETTRGAVGSIPRIRLRFRRRLVRISQTSVSRRRRRTGGRAGRPSSRERRVRRTSRPS